MLVCMDLDNKNVVSNRDNGGPACHVSEGCQDFTETFIEKSVVS